MIKMNHATEVNKIGVDIFVITDVDRPRRKYAYRLTQRCTTTQVTGVRPAAIGCRSSLPMAFNRCTQVTQPHGRHARLSSRRRRHLRTVFFLMQIPQLQLRRRSPFRHHRSQSTARFSYARLITEIFRSCCRRLFS